ncbi:hypothetical protein ACUV84_014334 [Puccinellia chinampoensis]
MASKVPIAVLLLLALSLTCCSSDVGDWQPERGTAMATWSGAPDGAGNEAGECGYFTAVKEFPWLSNVTAVSPAMFRGGAACGTCWELLQTHEDPRYYTPIRVVVTDVCRGGPCAVDEHHFDLSGHAFTLLGVDPKRGGRVAVSYTRVDCRYPQLSAYRVDGSSTTSNFAITPMYIPGYEMLNVSLVNGRGDPTAGKPMTRIRGAVFQTDATSLQLPYTVRLYYICTTKVAGYADVLVLQDGVIPVGWEPGHTYLSPPFLT